MTQNAATGQGFDAVEVGSDDYFDPTASDPNFPGVQGLQMRSHHFWQGDVEFDTYEAVGPTDQSVGIGTDGNPTTPDPNTPGGVIGVAPVVGEPGVFVIAEGRPSACEPEIGQHEDIIVIELHGVYGFPNGICKIPVTPEAPGPDFPSNTHWYPEIIGTGEIVVPGYEKLETVGWQSFWPNVASYDQDYCCISLDDLTLMGDPHDQSGPIANLIWTKRWGIVFRLVIGGSLFNDDVIITDFGYSDVFGAPNEVSYKITMKRFRTTSISSVSNPDADVDHFSNIPSNNTTTSTPADTQPVDPSGDGTTQNAVAPGNGYDPSNIGPRIATPIDPNTVFNDEGAARQAQAQGIDPHPLVQATVLPLTDSRTKGGGGVFHIFDGNKGETLNDLSWRMGVKWDDSQVNVNPQYTFTDPGSFNLPVGAKVNIALSSVTITTPNQTGPMGDPAKMVPGI